MEQIFYKIRLASGRILGPLNLERIKLFIAKDKIVGSEAACLHPTGEWKDIHQYPEIEELFLQKLQGRLKVDPTQEITEEEAQGVMPPSIHEEKTVIITADHQKTMIVEKPKEVEKPLESVPLDETPVLEDMMHPDSSIAHEKTRMLRVPSKKSAKTNNKKKKLIIAVVVVICILIILNTGNEKKPKIELPFKVEMPTTGVADPLKSEKIYLEALPFYNQDTVEGYKKAARIFLQAASADPNNAKALCLLASSYMNLIEVVKRDENYFTVITRLIELARAKGVDLAEMAIADIELYHVLGNPDAAMNRIVEFSKSHSFGAEMFYYLSLSFYLKGQYQDSLKYLNNVDPKNWFSARIPYLYGLIYEKNHETEEALRAFQETVKLSPHHMKAKLKLAEIFFQKDNLPEVSQHVDFIISHPEWASTSELARAYYFHARLLEVASKELEALHDLEIALKNSPQDEDVLLEYYTLKSKMGAQVNEAPEKAKMFHLLALGEKAIKENNFDEAMKNFLSAREVQYNDPIPLIRLADVFQHKGDLQTAKDYLLKAVKLTPTKVDLYPKLISLLVNTYEFEEAAHQLEIFKGLDPSVATVDRLQGSIYLKQDRLREAQAYYKIALSDASVDSSTYIAYATVMLKGNSFRDAAFYYGLALRFDPYNSEATIGIAKSLAELENLEKGVQYLQTALQLSPHKAELLNGIAELYVQKGDYESALKFVQNTLSADPHFFLAHKTRGDAFVGQDKYKEALDAYLTYTHLAPLDPRGHLARYELFFKKSDLKGAKDEIETVIRDYPRYPGAYAMLGELYKKGQNFPSALAAAKREIEINPHYLPAYVLAGTVLNTQKEYGKALELLNHVLKMDPNFVSALYQAGFANHMLKTYAAAQLMYERALTLDTGNPQIHKRLGYLFIDLSDSVKAKQHFRAYLDLLPDAPDRTEVERFLTQ